MTSTFLPSLKRHLPLGLFAVLWLDLIHLLSGNWEAREQYAYGWFVPILALGLFFRRWADRPSPEIRSQNSELSSDLRPPTSGFSFPLFASIVILALALLPLRVIFEINTDWPLIAWVYTLIVVGLTLCAIHLAGGGAWVRHFAFPVALILVAVVWPSRIEKGLTQNLMQIAASLTVEILGWFGVPAFQRGNLIEVSTGVLGVDEACSGIRSFQSTLMVGLFLGELYRLRFWARGGLVVGGLGLAFCFNIVRTLFLTWQANAHGLSAIEKWHDPAGFAIALACFFALWLIAVLVKRWTASAPVQSSMFNVECSKLPACEPAQPSTLNPQLRETSALHPPPSGPAFSIQLSTFCFGNWRRYAAAVGCWSLLCLLATELWYRSHEVKDTGVFHWTASFPTNLPAYREIDLPPRTKALIGSDLTKTGSWAGGDGFQWTVYFFRWNPTSIQNLLRARVHRPERCLPAAGLQLVTDDGVEKFAAGGLQLPFQQSTYESGGKTLHVFFCQWEDGNEKQGGVWGSKLADRIRSVLVGRRKLGQQTMEVILTGPDSLKEAAQALRNLLPSLVNVATPNPQIRGGL